MGTNMRSMPAQKNTALVLYLCPSRLAVSATATDASPKAVHRAIRDAHHRLKCDSKWDDRTADAFVIGVEMYRSSPRTAVASVIGVAMYRASPRGVDNRCVSQGVDVTAENGDPSR